MLCQLVGGVAEGTLGLRQVGRALSLTSTRVPVNAQAGRCSMNDWQVLTLTRKAPRASFASHSVATTLID